MWLPPFPWLEQDGFLSRFYKEKMPKDGLQAAEHPSVNIAEAAPSYVRRTCMKVAFLRPVRQDRRAFLVQHHFGVECKLFRERRRLHMGSHG